MHIVRPYVFLCFRFHDSVSGGHYKVRTVFQVFIQPGTYSVHIANRRGEREEKVGPQMLEWHAADRTYIVHSLWIFMDRTAAK